MISIITSLYKSDRYLESYGEKLLKFADFLQKEKAPFELIAIANDPTPAELEFSKKFSKYAWFSFVPVGRETLYATWNRGVDIAKGELLGFWNTDDIRFPESLVEAQGLFEKGADLVYFPFKVCRYLKVFGRYFLVHKQRIDKQLPEYDQITRKEFFRSMIVGPFFMFTKNFYKRVGPFDEQFKAAGDFDWQIRAAKISEKFVRAKTLAGEFRVDGGGLTAGKNNMLVAENNAVYIRHNVPEKIQLVDQKLMDKYNPKKLFSKGSSINFKIN
jgi:GT2 family glycosyltransferase